MTAPAEHPSPAPHGRRARRRCSPAAAVKSLSPDAVAAHRPQLPAPADLLAICRRGLCAPRLLGRRVDDARPRAALPAVRHVRPRLRRRTRRRRRRGGICRGATAAGAAPTRAAARLRPCRDCDAPALGMRQRIGSCGKIRDAAARVSVPIVPVDRAAAAHPATRVPLPFDTRRAPGPDRQRRRRRRGS